MEINGMRFNHYSIGVADLKKSKHFYQNILGLELISRPDFDFNGAWFQIDPGVQLHLIENKNIEVFFSDSRKLHFALAVSDIYLVRNKLEKLGVHCAIDIKSRPDGVLQFYIIDPDGYFIEITEI